MILYPSRFAKEYKAKFSLAFGSNGKLLQTMQAEDFKKRSRQVITKAKEEIGKCRGRCDLSLFTPWFSDFTTMYSAEGPFAENEHTLFLPRMASAGLFSNSNDVQVLGFGKTVSIFSSKQKPKMLTIYADDFSSYNFIVKVGIVGNKHSFSTFAIGAFSARLLRE